MKIDEKKLAIIIHNHMSYPKVNKWEDITVSGQAWLCRLINELVSRKDEWSVDDD